MFFVIFFKWTCRPYGSGRLFTDNMSQFEAELQTVLDRTVEFVTAMLPAEGGCSVILWDKVKQYFVTSASTVPSQADKQLAAKRVRTTGGATRWIVDNCKPLIVSDIRDDPFTANKLLSEFSLQAYIGVPLIVDSAVEGVLYAMNHEVREYTEEDVKLLSDCASIIALAISKSRMVYDLEQTNAALELYVHTVTHDIRSPLSLAYGYLNIVTSDFDVLDAPEKREYLDSSEKMLNKSFRIIDELLLLTQIRSDHVVDYAPLLMGEISIEVQERVQPLIDEVQGTLIIPEQWLNRVVGYAPWVEEIWVNYISNAIKYGGNPPIIELGATDDKDSVRFWVRDNGNGLTIQQQQALFKPFSRVNPNARIKGHGLGLSIVRHITERMDGIVGVQSEVGQGSEFYFTLPKANQEVSVF